MRTQLSQEPGLQVQVLSLIISVTLAGLGPHQAVIKLTTHSGLTINTPGYTC